MINLANRLRALRIQKDVDTISLAEELGISETTYRRYERNESTPDFQILQKIADFYQINITELLSDDKIIFSNEQKGGTSNNALIINQLSEKLIQQYEERIKQYEERIKEKDEIIKELKDSKI